MKNRKFRGFTLIELMGVIIIIAVVAIITTTILLNIFKNVRKEAFRNSVYAAIHATEIYVETKEIDSLDENGIDIFDKSIKLKNNNFTSGKMFVNKKIVSAFIVTNDEFCASGTMENLKVVEGSCDQLDETAPTDLAIKMKKVNSIGIESDYDGKNWIDESVKLTFSAKDEQTQIKEYLYSFDEKLPNNLWEKTDSTLIIEETSDSSKGTTIYVKAVDSASNVSETSSVTFKIDKIIPTTGTYTVGGSLGLNGWYTSNITLTPNKNGVCGPSGCIYSLNLTSLNTETKGTSIVLTAVNGVGVSAVNTSNVKIDKTAPVISNGSVALGSMSYTATDSISDVSAKYYFVNTTGTTPTYTTSGWTTSNTYATSCGNTYHMWAYSVNKAGLKSQVIKLGQLSSASCCSLPSNGSSCSYSGQTTSCNGTTMYCRVETTNSYWYLSSGSIAGSISSYLTTATCSCTSWNGGTYNDGGCYTGRISGSTLTDYNATSCNVPLFSFTCTASCAYRWRY